MPAVPQRVLGADAETGAAGQAPLAERAAPRPIDVADLPEGFSETIVATGLTGATGMVVASDGRLFVCEQTGTLRVVKDDKLLPEPFLTVEVDSLWERGLIGVALDPEFPKKPNVYVCYVAPKPYPHHRVSRFTARGDVAEPGSEVILLEGDDQTKMGGHVPAGHQGGGLQFGKDGKLYIGIGEHTAGAPSQHLDTKPAGPPERLRPPMVIKPFGKVGGKPLYPPITMGDRVTGQSGVPWRTHNCGRSSATCTE